MPVRALLALLLCAGAAQAQPQSIWPPRPLPLAAQIGDYRQLECPKAVPEPYTGALQIDSKYDQSDASRSTLSGKVSARSKETHARLAEYTQRLAQFADYLVQAKNPRQAGTALACLDQWLQAWAEAGAIESRDASKTGLAARKWALAAIASTLLKSQALSGGRPALSSAQKAWLQRLAEQVMDDYRPRQAADFAYFNNHDYWAGWAVAASGMLLGRDDYVAWGERNFRRGLAQITDSPHGPYAYLPNELGRGPLAANYTHYAMVPLLLLAESSRYNGPGLSAEDDRRLQRLADFAALSLLDPQRLAELRGQPQHEVPPYKLVWLLPFLDLYPQHALALRLQASAGVAATAYGQLGGRLAPLYPHVAR